MKKLFYLLLSFLVITAAILAFVFNSKLIQTASAHQSSHHYGSFDSTSPDSSTCGNNWANDTFDRSFTIQDGSPNVVLEKFDDGTFVTLAGPSPNACVILGGPAGNGNTVANGIKGRFSGSFDVLVTGGTFNPHAKCTSSHCNTTAGFVATIYGPTAQFTTGAAFFVFDYYTSANGSWHNASANRGGDNGDITGMPVSNHHEAISING